MKIIQLEIVNQKTIRCFQKDLDGKNLELAGDTGSGKTTAVSALWEVLKRGNDMLTHGEHKGHIRVVLGDGSDTTFVAERINTPKTSSINVTRFVGKIPRTVSTKDFEAMLSKLSVNPHRIAQMKPKERMMALLSAAELEIDLDAMDDEIKAAEDERLYAKRTADNAKPAGEMPEMIEKVSVSDLIAERDKIQEDNRGIEKNIASLELLKQEQRKDSELISERVGEIYDLKMKIEELGFDIERGKERVEQRKERIDKGVEWKKTATLAETSDLDKKIANAELTNAGAAIFARSIEDQENHSNLVEIHELAADKVNGLNKQRKEALNGAKWPLEGLCVKEGDVYYNDILFDNLGESEQMLATAAIALGDICKHDFKIARMDGVESMSQVDYGKLRDLFNEHGVQILSTRVSRTGAEDGEIEIIEGKYQEVHNAETSK